MENLGDVGLVEPRFDPMELLGNVGHVEPRFDPFGDSANLTQDRCKACAEHTIGLEIILDPPDGTPR